MSGLWQFLDDVTDDYSNTDWLAEAMASDPISDADLFDGIDTFYLQDGIIETDTQVLVEYIDTDGAHGFGIVQSWHANPFAIEATDTDYAFIIREGEGTTYAHESQLIPICEVAQNENTLQGVSNTTSDSGHIITVPQCEVLPQLQPAAHLTTMEAS